VAMHRFKSRGKRRLYWTSTRTLVRPVPAQLENSGSHACAGQKARTCAWGRACASAIGMMETTQILADTSKRRGEPQGEGRQERRSPDIVVCKPRRRRRGARGLASPVIRGARAQMASCTAPSTGDHLASSGS
jgi:hypothetical protein